MASYQVLRHTCSKDEIAVLREALDKYHKDPKTQESNKHHASFLIARLGAIHRLSMSYVTQEQK